MHFRLITAFAAAVLCRYATAQEVGPTPDVPVKSLHIGADSGIVSNDGDQIAVIYAEEIHAPKSGWVRLEFGDVLLSGQPDTSNESMLVITSLTHY